MSTLQDFEKIASFYVGDNQQRAKDIETIGRICKSFRPPQIWDDGHGAKTSAQFIGGRLAEYMILCKAQGVFPVFYKESYLWTRYLIPKYDNFQERLNSILMLADDSKYEAFFNYIDSEQNVIDFEEHVAELYDRNKIPVIKSQDMLHSNAYFASLARCLTPSFKVRIWPSLMPHPIDITRSHVLLDEMALLSAKNRVLMEKSILRISDETDKMFQMLIIMRVLSLAVWLRFNPTVLLVNIDDDKAFYDWSGIVNMTPGLKDKYPLNGSMALTSFAELLDAFEFQVMNMAGIHSSDYISPFDKRLLFLPAAITRKQSLSDTDLSEINVLINDSLDYLSAKKKDLPFLVKRFKHYQKIINMLEGYYDCLHWGGINSEFTKKAIRTPLLLIPGLKDEVNVGHMAEMISFIGRYLYICKKMKVPPLLLMAMDADFVEREGLPTLHQK